MGIQQNQEGNKMKNIMWIVYAAMILITVNSSLAATFFDDFNNGNLSSEGWTTIGTVIEENGSVHTDDYSGDDLIYQNLSVTYGINFNQGFQVILNLTTLPNDNYQFPIFGMFNGNSWLNGDYVLFEPAVDLLDSTTNDDLRIECGGTCSCTPTALYDNTESANYIVNMSYDMLTGNATIIRDDGYNISTIVTGCDVSTLQPLLFFRAAYVWYNSFEFTGFTNVTCTPNWSCSAYAACLPNSTQYCNVAVDNNSCGGSYTGNYSEFLPQACVYGNQTGYQPQYTVSDYVAIVGDGLGTAGAVFVSFIALIVIVGLVVWGYKQYKKVKQ
jgi:hypothetical protein